MNPTALPFDVAKQSLTGNRHQNQDRCQVLVAQAAVMLSLADGLGGHPRGEVAAQLLVDVAEHMFRASPKPLDDPTRFMLRVMSKSHRSILDFGKRQDPPIAPRTTAVIAVVQDGHLFSAHVGDSRFYLVRNGRIFARSQDHSIRLQPLGDGTDRARGRVSLTRCLGGVRETPPVTTCTPPIPLQRGDVVLICSDGLWNQVPPEALVAAFQRPDIAIDRQLQALAQLAASGARSDNVSAIAMRWHDTGASCARTGVPGADRTTT
jgi:PPM family protein phosphatase